MNLPAQGPQKLGMSFHVVMDVVATRGTIQRLPQNAAGVNA